MQAVALTIAGSDSGGGAGIQADLKSFAAHGVFGTSVICAVTAQNTRGVSASVEVPLDLIEAQFAAVMSDFPVGAAKTGMLSSAAIIERVAALLRQRPIPLIVDPVMVAKGGAHLLEPAAVQTLRAKLLPIATLITPNLPEATQLTGRALGEGASRAERLAAARALLDLGPKAVLLKGGHLAGAAEDLLLEEGGPTWLSSPRIDTTSTHGTGCTLSASIAALLARGEGLSGAISKAKAYVEAALRSAPALGAGHGPLQHFPPGYPLKP